MTGFGYVSLTTDYGLSDGFVAACHGVLARLAPGVRCLDVTHLVPPGDVVRAAAVLAQTAPYLPPAVHVVVVDPGVGTSRRAVAVATATAVLVGPDNGVLPPVADALGGARGAVELTNPAWFADQVCPTFHGRDLFLPVAARLALGADVAQAGPAARPDTLVRTPPPRVRRDGDLLEAEVLTVDRFGNVQLAAPGAALAGLGDRLAAGGLPAVRGTTFADAAPGGLVVLVDSAGLVAVAVNGGDAAALLEVSAGDLIRITGTSQLD
jgi:S-adenosylmethionine hydrolase